MEVRAAGRRQLLGERAVVSIGRVEIAIEDGGRAAETLVSRHGLGHDELQALPTGTGDGRRLLGQGDNLDGDRLRLRLLQREPFDPVVIAFKVGLEGEGLSIALSGCCADADARRRLAVIGHRRKGLQSARLSQHVEQLVDAAIVAVALGQGDGPQVSRIAKVGGVKPQALRVVVEGGIVQVGDGADRADAAVGHRAARAVARIGKGVARHGLGKNGVNVRRHLPAHRLGAGHLGEIGEGIGEHLGLRCEQLVVRSRDGFGRRRGSGLGSALGSRRTAGCSIAFASRRASVISLRVPAGRPFVLGRLRIQLGPDAHLAGRLAAAGHHVGQGAEEHVQ